MSQSSIKYYCKLCEYGCGQKSHIDSHKITAGHLEKCNDMIVTLKTNKGLYHKYIVELNINEEDDKTMHMLRQEIIDKLSTIYRQNVDVGIECAPKIVITNTKTEPQLELIHELTQFTHGKTEQTLNKICERYIFNSISSDAHIIQFIIIISIILYLFILSTLFHPTRILFKLLLPINHSAKPNNGRYEQEIK